MLILKVNRLESLIYSHRSAKPGWAEQHCAGAHGQRLRGAPAVFGIVLGERLCRLPVLHPAPFKAKYGLKMQQVRQVMMNEGLMSLA